MPTFAPLLDLSQRIADELRARQPYGRLPPGPPEPASELRLVSDVWLMQTSPGEVVERSISAMFREGSEPSGSMSKRCCFSE